MPPPSVNPNADPVNDAIEAAWGPGGTLADAVPGFEPRGQQTAMARAVADALDTDRTVLVEAGTGTGKTLAYLFPAVLSGKKVVVSTGTRALQDQLASREIPLVERALDREVDWCVLKGRENYLCLLRSEDAGAAPSRSPHGDAALDAIREWARTTVAGDRAELAWLADDDPIWPTVSVTAEQCLGSNCPRYEPCFLTQAKRRAARADLVIVNHALFFADLAAGPHASGSIVPHHTAVIFDEAHMLEEVATSHWGVSVSRHRVRDLLADLRREPLPEPEAGRATLSEAADRAQAAAERAFDALRAVVGSDAVRTRWSPDGAERAAAAGLDLLARLAELKQGIDALGAASEGWARLAERVAALARDARFLWRAEDPAYVFWAETGGAAVRLSASPLDVSSILREALFSSGMPCILTSATLTAGGSFGYLRSRLGIDDAEEVVLASPFDYQTQALVYVPREFPLPRETGFIDAVADEVVRIVAASRGRAFVLFTSHRALDRVFEQCRQRLDYPVVKQGDGPRMALIERFKAVPSVLFATMGFWQGIDVPGEALSCVVLDKLPFAPPDDPLVQARTRALESDGFDPFGAYQLPAAAIWLKQGFGRLIRSRRDRGVIAILDRRLVTHGYGRFFLDSLPPAPVTSSFAEVARFFAPMGTDSPVHGYAPHDL